MCSAALALGVRGHAPPENFETVEGLFFPIYTWMMTKVYILGGVWWVTRLEFHINTKT